MLIGDFVNVDDRCRVFNTFVIGALADGTIFKKITKTKNIILFVYKFSTNDFTSHGVIKLSELKKKYKSADESGVNHFKNIDKQVFEDKSKFHIFVFHYGIGDGFHPSMYHFYQDDIQYWDAKVMIGKPPKISDFNLWFSNKILKSMIEWNNINWKNIFDHTKDEIPVLTYEKIKSKKLKLYSQKLDDYIFDCQCALVPLDMQELIKTEAKSGHLVIFNVINYLRDYFLLIQVAKEEDDTYTLTFVSSPNDTSLD